MADSAVAMAMVDLVERDEQFTTVEMKINYIIPFEKGEATA
jgi:acyl-coenzyme A thioesterase PaaI-like protein